MKPVRKPISNYMAIKNKIKAMPYTEADKYIDKMYNNGVITAKQLMNLDIFLIELHPCIK